MNFEIPNPLRDRPGMTSSFGVKGLGGGGGIKNCHFDDLMSKKVKQGKRGGWKYSVLDDAMDGPEHSVRESCMR